MISNNIILMNFQLKNMNINFNNNLNKNRDHHLKNKYNHLKNKNNLCKITVVKTTNPANILLIDSRDFKKIKIMYLSQDI